MGNGNKFDIGYYKQDLKHGYAKLNLNGVLTEGLFEKMVHKKEVTDYDAKKAWIA